MPTSRRTPAASLCDSSHANHRAEALLHFLESRDELRERGRGRAPAFDPRARDVRTIPGKGRARVDQHRLRRLRALLVSNVVQRGRVLAQRDDVLVGRLGVILPGGPKVCEVELELGAVGALEEPSQLVVAEGSAPVGFREALHLIGRLAHSQLIELAHDILWIDGSDAQRGGRPHLIPHERDAPRKRWQSSNRYLERTPEVIALRRCGRFPETRLP
jgi:hypothetical protein